MPCSQGHIFPVKCTVLLNVLPSSVMMEKYHLVEHVRD
jgi:hypothetical protein